MNAVSGYVSGKVQGVGFRYFVKRHAEQLGLSGFVRNMPDGRVQFEIQGDQQAITSLLALIKQGPSFSSVADVEVKEQKAENSSNQFLIY